MTPLDAMRSALDVLLDIRDFRPHDRCNKAIINLRTAITELEKAEPVAYLAITREGEQLSKTCDPWYPNSTPLFLHPAQSRDSIIEECVAVCDALRQEWARLKVGAYDGRYDMMEEAATVCEDSIRTLKGK